MSLTTGLDTGAGTGATTTARAQAARNREVAEDAQRLVDLQDENPYPDRQGAEQDDAPQIHDEAERPIQDEDDAISEQSDPPDRAAGWDPWVRLSIFRDGWGVGYHVEHPDAADKALEEALDVQDRAWASLAETLIAAQPEALACNTQLEALEALWEARKQDYERSVGQLSRDRQVVIGTPFGLVPLDFFFLGRRSLGDDDRLFADLRSVGGHLLDTGAQELPVGRLRELLPHLSEPRIESTRKHTRALLGALRQPRIVTRHRQLWPQTSAHALFDDLGFARGRTSGRSEPVGILAILGVFDRRHPVLARGTQPRLPRGAKTS